MSEVEIRPIRPSEKAALAQMLFDAFDDEYTMDVWRKVVQKQARHEGRTLCAFVDEEPVSTAYVDEYSMQIGDQVVPVGAIANVATRHDMRKRGLAGDVLRRAIGVMKEAGYPLSILITPLPGYYGSFGYHVIPECRFSIDVSGPTPAAEGAFEIQRWNPEKHLDGVRKLHQLWRSRFSGPCPRSPEKWVSPSLWEPDDPERFLVAVREEEIAAYVRGRKGKPRIVSEFAASDADAGVALLARMMQAARAGGEECIRGQLCLGEDVLRALRQNRVAVEQASASGSDDDFEVPMLAFLDLRAFFKAFEQTLAARVDRASMAGNVRVGLGCESGSVGITLRDGVLTTGQVEGPSMELTDAQMVEMATGARGAEEIGFTHRLPTDGRALLSALFPQTGFILWPADHF